MGGRPSNKEMNRIYLTHGDGLLLCVANGASRRGAVRVFIGRFLILSIAGCLILVYYVRRVRALVITLFPFTVRCE